MGFHCIQEAPGGWAADIFPGLVEASKGGFLTQDSPKKGSGFRGLGV